jgi:hypothetical protein
MSLACAAGDPVRSGISPAARYRGTFQCHLPDPCLVGFMSASAFGLLTDRPGHEGPGLGFSSVAGPPLFMDIRPGFEVHPDARRELPTGAQRSSKRREALTVFWAPAPVRQHRGASRCKAPGSMSRVVPHRKALSQGSFPIPPPCHSLLPPPRRESPDPALRTLAAGVRHLR